MTSSTPESDTSRTRGDAEAEDASGDDDDFDPVTDKKIKELVTMLIR